MNTISWLTRHIAERERHLAEGMARLEAAPGSFALGLLVRNIQDHVAELRHQLHLAQSERNKELFELRLSGVQLECGPIPLPLLARIAGPLNSLITGAAYRNRYHHDATHGFPDEWIDALDLRLAAVTPGSSRLMLTGNVTPDLAGDSALQDGLSAVFDLLTAPAEKAVERIHDIGITAGRSLVDLLGVLERDRLTCVLSWTTPANEARTWGAGLQEITLLRQLLVSIGEPTETIESLFGVVTLLAATGRIEVLPDRESACVKIRFDKRAPELVRGLTLGTYAEFVVVCTRYQDPIKNTEIRRYRLHEVKTTAH